MKKLILLLLFIPLVSFGQQTFEDPEFIETTLETPGAVPEFSLLQSEDIERYRIYSTTNNYISLLLDTQTGKLWMVQIAVGDGVAMKTVLSDVSWSYTLKEAKEALKSSLDFWESDTAEDNEAFKPKWEDFKEDIGVIGQYKLYQTKKMYNFIMVDVINGSTWQVQWSIDKDKRLVQVIY